MFSQIEIIDRGRNVVFLKQERYIDAVVDNMEVSGDNTAYYSPRRKTIPLSPGYDLSSEEYYQGGSAMPIIGKLRYVIDNTRFDAMAALGILSENGQNANDKQFNGLLNLTSYLYTTKGDALKLYAEKERDLELFAFSDASYNIGTAKSRLGGVFYLGYESGAFACFSKKDENKSNSTMEAELKAIERTARQIIIYRNLLEELGHKQLKPTTIYTDSEATVKLFKYYQNSKKLKHIMKTINLIRHAINQRIIKLVFIRAEYNVADLMTKAVAKRLFLELKPLLMLGYNEIKLRNMIEDSRTKDLERMEVIDEQQDETRSEIDYLDRKNQNRNMDYEEMDWKFRQKAGLINKYSYWE